MVVIICEKMSAALYNNLFYSAQIIYLDILIFIINFVMQSLIQVPLLQPRIAYLLTTDHWMKNE